MIALRSDTMARSLLEISSSILITERFRLSYDGAQCINTMNSSSSLSMAAPVPGLCSEENPLSPDARALLDQFRIILLSLFFTSSFALFLRPYCFVIKPIQRASRNIHEYLVANICSSEHIYQ